MLENLLKCTWCCAVCCVEDMHETHCFRGPKIRPIQVVGGGTGQGEGQRKAQKGWVMDGSACGGRWEVDPPFGQNVNLRSWPGQPIFFVGTWSCADNFRDASPSRPIRVAVCYLGKEYIFTGEGEYFLLSLGRAAALRALG